MAACLRTSEAGEKLPSESEGNFSPCAFAAQLRFPNQLAVAAVTPGRDEHMVPLGFLQTYAVAEIPARADSSLFPADDVLCPIHGPRRRKGGCSGRGFTLEFDRNVILGTPRSARSRTPAVVRAKISAGDFDKQISERLGRICFVGMSNCGKSHWSNVLRIEHDYELLSVDEHIEKAIEPELRELGFAGIDGMAEWMGFPTDDRFLDNQTKYLKLEEKITSAACGALSSKTRNCVLDTTGSVVYLSDRTLQAMMSRFLVVHLEASDDMLDIMTENYFATPKPVVWGDLFQQDRGEDPKAALRRCYPRLLRERRKRYAKLAHVSVPAAISLSRDICSTEFLSYIRTQLPPQDLSCAEVVM
jgi:shikimate kinase